MIGVDDEVAGRQRRELGEEGVGALAALAAADEPVAEHVLLGEQGDVAAGEAVIELDHRERDRPAGAQRLLPGLDLDDLGQAMIGEQALEPLARAVRIAGEHHLALGAAQVGDMGDDRLVDVGALRPLRREIARRVDPEVERPRRSPGSWNGVTRCSGRAGDQRLPFRRATDRASRARAAGSCRRPLVWARLRFS